jgi:dihydropteroate synthase
VNPEKFKKWLALGGGIQNNTPLVMGILNLTPDSFSDGGKYNLLDSAFAKVLEMIEQGADIIDIGAESSRPGAKMVSADEEIARLQPLLKKLRQSTDICISVDTYKPDVMQVALDLGVDIINDIYSLQHKGAAEIVGQYDASVCLMHQNKQHHEADRRLWHSSQDIFKELFDFFEERLAILGDLGLERERFILDPGIGFGKGCRDNLMLLKNLDKLKAFELPLLVGASRKTFIGEVLDKNVDARLFGGCAVTAYTFLRGAHIHRTHDVVATKDTLLMLKAILEQDTNND